MIARDAARSVFAGALARVDARALACAAAAHLREPVRLLAVGKAAWTMARGVCDACTVVDGLVVTKDGHAGAAPLPVHVVEAGHPVPDARSLAAGEDLLARAEGRLVLCVSGGASALAVAPFGVSFADKVAAARAVAAAGADIGALNAVRKHLSRLKGGRLAAATRGEILALVLSDVVGDDPATVGGGPAAPDPTTYADALAVAARAPGVPESVLAHLRAGARGAFPETPKALANVELRVLAGPDALYRAALDAAQALGLAVDGAPGFTGSVDALAALLAERAGGLAPGRAFVVVGEPTIRLGAVVGRGGRAQHTALLVAAAGLPDGVAVLCAGSDGTDGPTADAGAIVDAGTAARAGDAAAALARFDSGSALAAAGDLLTTGPTGTNLCDLYVVVAS